MSNALSRVRGDADAQGLFSRLPVFQGAEHANLFM